MQLQTIAEGLLSLLPAIYGVAFGHNSDLIAVAESLEAVAATLRQADAETNPQSIAVPPSPAVVK